MRSPGFDPSSIHVKCVMDEVTLEEVFLRVLGFPLDISFYECFIIILIYTLFLTNEQMGEVGNFPLVIILHSVVR